jgi:hypothetical protein
LVSLERPCFSQAYAIISYNYQTHTKVFSKLKESIFFFFVFFFLMGVRL